MTNNPSANHRAMQVRGGSGAMFDGIARRYDLLNRLMSFGLDIRWRNQAVRALNIDGPSRILDLATGTADLALAIAQSNAETAVVGVDPSVGMLDVGQRKVADMALDSRITLETGDAQNLRFADDTFDGISMAFGIRNVPDRPRALAEMARVTRPGGRIAIIELSEPRTGLLGKIARFHIHKLVPRLGAWISGAREYRYLQQSIAAFPPAAQFAAMMETAGIDIIAVKPLTFGVCHLYVGTPRHAAASAPGALGKEGQ